MSRRSGWPLWVQHHNGIFGSTDAGRNWTEFTGVKPAVFGFAVAVHPHDPQTAWFVPGVSRMNAASPSTGSSASRGPATGESPLNPLRNGLPQSHCYDVIFRHGLDVDESGNRLAMGSSTGSLWISENGGDDWKCLNSHLPQIYSVRFSRLNS